MFERLTPFLDSFLAVGIPGIDTIVKMHGETVYRHIAGYSDKAKGIPMNGSEHYFIYSCSKVITVTAAMQLWEKKLFSLEDHLSDYMPEFKQMTVQTKDGIKPAKNDITIKDLFMMTAGFSYNLHSPSLEKGIKDTGGKSPTREMMKYLAQEPLLFEPGSSWEYSLCHDCLAALVEVITGKLFNDVVTKEIFEPMGMADSTFLPNEEECSKIIQLHTGATEDQSVIPIPTVCSYRIGTEYASGGAGCASTVEDYVKFMEGLRTFKLLKPDTIKLITTDHLTEQQKAAFWYQEFSYGLGVRCPLKSGATTTDYGWGGAAGAWLSIDPVHDCVIYHGQHVLCSPNHGQRGQIMNYIDFN